MIKYIIQRKNVNTKIFKKKVIFFVLLILLISVPNIKLAASITLSEIANVFNNCDEVQNFKNDGSDVETTVSGDSLKITFSSQDFESETIYNLEGNILTTTFPFNDLSSLTSALMTSILVDCIGTFHGYSEGDLFATLNEDTIKNYTIENEGYEIKQLEDGNIKVQVDISKKIPLINTSTLYLDASDLEFIKEFISGDGSAQTSKGNLIFHKSGYGDDATIFIGEKNELTTNTYNSILSVLDVMFDSDDVTKYFKENYSNLSMENKNFKGFIIEINPEKSTMEETVLGSDNTYKFIRITINKKDINLAISTRPNVPIGNTVKNENNDDSTIKTGTLPKTGISKILTFAIFVLSLSTIIAIFKNNNYKDIK